MTDKSFYSDLDKVLTGIGDKLTYFFQWVTTFFAGLVIGFVEDWRLTLVLLGASPFIIVSALIMAKVTSPFLFNRVALRGHLHHLNYVDPQLFYLYLLNHVLFM